MSNIIGHGRFIRPFHATEEFTLECIKEFDDKYWMYRDYCASLADDFRYMHPCSEAIYFKLFQRSKED